MTDAICCLEISGAKQPPVWEVYARLCETTVFRQRVGWQHHELVVRHLLSAGRPLLAALEIRQIVAHHLFGSASHHGRHNALAKPSETLDLLRKSVLPPAAAQRRQAPWLRAKHLRNLEPEPGEILHQWVLRRADALVRGFFEPRPGSRSGALWGQRFVSAFGRDWYQQCLGTMSKASVRNVCRGNFSALRVSV